MKKLTSEGESGLESLTGDREGLWCTPPSEVLAVAGQGDWGRGSGGHAARHSARPASGSAKSSWTVNATVGGSAVVPASRFDPLTQDQCLGSTTTPSGSVTEAAEAAAASRASRTAVAGQDVLVRVGMARDTGPGRDLAAT